MTDSNDDALFEEPGARWRSLLWGPVFCAAVLVFELLTGPVVHWVALAVVAVVLTGFTYVQVSAARRHVSVALTATELRQGTERLSIADIAVVFPAPEYAAGEYEPKKWETARVLGELTGIPRRRRGVGLRLVGGGLVQAWAKDDDGLREALGEVVVSDR
ncbi:hypothetical protein [Rhodococcoides fascians]|uniref:hypothetical protein n=1 Tax=Rhodococcoides fascians TaxID=1828 RepID=UPI00056B9C8C|nr:MULTISPECIES: hypothetical protein [Rhodococcus]OZE99563.1 hypothetical protein CH301_15595 [Rhodococcus sp. 15-1189-1-1a]OZF13853.1 hypothetical protein CH299_15375 [Rhodococcus sp. 14-2686-1-2]